MKEMSATDAARQFSAMLDAVEHKHQTFVIHRGGKVVASVAPVRTANGALVKDLLERHPADPLWGKELRALRNQLIVEDRR